ncbi:hypothetical protein ACTXT7_009519 [Hymenolepis weldensis]
MRIHKGKREMRDRRREEDVGAESKRTNDGPLSHDNTTTSSQQNDLPIRSPSSSIKNLRLYACPMCDKTYKFRRGWRRHIHIVHKNLPTKNRQRLNDGKARNRPKPFSCDTCDQRFSCLSQRREHIDAVHKRLRQHPCPICGRRFLYSYDVPKHINIIHKKIKPYKCDTCGMSFTYFTQRKSHIDIVHKKLKQYICSNCNQSFNCRADLCKHGKEAHLGLRLHKCEICEKTYPDKATLKKHVRFVHEGVKNYMCESCGKGFPTASVYRLHVNVVHRGIKPFKCEFCQKSFATPAKCRRHVSAIHQESEPPLTRDVVDPSRPIEVMDLTTDDGVVARGDGNTSSPSPAPVEVMDLNTDDVPNVEHKELRSPKCTEQTLMRVQEGKREMRDRGDEKEGGIALWSLPDEKLEFFHLIRQTYPFLSLGVNMESGTSDFVDKDAN